MRDALTVRQEHFSVEPRDAADEIALDEKVEALSAQAGFTGPKGDRQASRAMIRALLTARLLVTLEYAGERGEAGMVCLTSGLVEEGFVILTEAEAAAARNSLSLTDGPGMGARR